MQKLHMSLLAATITGLTATGAFAEVITLQGPAVTDDATVNSFFDDRQYQAVTPGNLELQGRQTSSRGWAVVRFELPALQPGEYISDATMTFEYFETTNASAGTQNVNLHRLLYGWTESEVTWLERSTGQRWAPGDGNIGYQDGSDPPANYDEPSLGTISLTNDQYGLKTFQSAALTAVLNDMAAGVLPNHGFLLNAGSSGGPNARYYLVSSDRPGDVFHPQLQLTVVPEPATLGLLAFGGLLTLGRRRDG